MTEQHVVELEGVRLTRLPPGRAEGRVWLTFVGTGPALHPGDDGDIAWRLRSHLRISWLDGAAVEVDGGSAGGGDGLMHFGLVLLDAGGSSLVLEYVDGPDDLGREVVRVID